MSSSWRSRAEIAGLTPLDEERARSMADEGGASAATIEGQDVGSRPDGSEPFRRPREHRLPGG